jgi:predicted nucleic acid-binding protein
MGGGGRDCFLIDTSACSRFPRVAEDQTGWGDLAEEGRISICDPTKSELLYSARSAAQYKAMSDGLDQMYTWRLVPDDAWRRVHDLQERLAHGGCLRLAGVVDLLVAVTAQHHRLTILHYDRDFETIARYADLKTRWLAEPGTIV